MKAASIPIAIFLVCAGGAEAFAYCSEPQAPSCATRYGAFDDENDFEDCKRKMRSYSDEVDSFVSCQRDIVEEAEQKAKRESDEAIEKARRAVQSFNRRAQGG